MQDEHFEWHDKKARSNISSHGITFEDAVLAFDDDLAIDDIDESMDYGEERWKLTGMVRDRLLVVIYTLRGERIRIISARKAERDEQERYLDQGC